MHSLDLLEAFLDGWLTFVGFEDLYSGEIAIVANERVHAVAVLVVIDGGLIDGPFQVVATERDAPVLGVGSLPAALLLFEGVFWARDPLDLQIPAYPVLLEDYLDLEVDTGTAADPGPSPQDPSAQVRERLGGGGDIAVTARLLTQREQRAPDPDQREPFSGPERITVNRPDVACPILAPGVGPIPNHLPGRGLSLNKLTKVFILPP